MAVPQSNRKRAAQQTADRVRDAILRGELVPGTDLPGERELSERLGVSRLTLRSALARLEVEGLVRPVHGSGTRILDFRESGGVDLIGYLATQAMEGGTVPFELLTDLLEMRRMVAVELLSLVTERASDEELDALAAPHGELGALVDRPLEFMHADLGFARLMVRAGHNLALELLYNSVVRIIDGHPGLLLAFQTNASETVTAYGRLIELIRKRQPSRVIGVARRLLTGLDRATLSRISEITGQAPVVDGKEDQ